jgi:hypothetical protein
MPECHKCRMVHNSNQTPRRKRGWKKSPCSTCEGPRDDNHVGRTFVRWYDQADAIRNNVAAAEEVAVTRCSDDLVLAFSVMLRGFMSLPSKTRDVVAYIVLNRSATYSSAARAFRCTRQRINTRLNKATRKWPLLKHLIVRKVDSVAKGEGATHASQST